MRMAKRDPDREESARAEGALRRDGAAMQAHQFLYEGQADSAALVRASVRALHAVKTLEQPSELVLRGRRRRCPRPRSTAVRPSACRRSATRPANVNLSAFDRRLRTMRSH